MQYGLRKGDIISIAIDALEHQKLTNAMRDIIAYNSKIAIEQGKLTTSTATAQQIWDATIKVYTELDMTQYLTMLKQQLEKTFKGSIDWRGW